MKQPEYIKAFICGSRQNYYGAARAPQNRIMDRITFGNYATDGCGCEYECSMAWISLAGGVAPRLDIFNDAFKVFQEHQPLFNVLVSLHRQDFTPDDFRCLLLELGYKDCSDNAVAASK